MVPPIFEDNNTVAEQLHNSAVLYRVALLYSLASSHSFFYYSKSNNNVGVVVVVVAKRCVWPKAFLVYIFYLHGFKYVDTSWHQKSFGAPETRGEAHARKDESRSIWVRALVLGIETS